MRAAFSSNGAWLAITQEGHLQVFDSLTGELATEWQAFESGIASVAFSPDGELIAVGPSFTNQESAVRLFNRATGKMVAELEGHTSWVSGIEFSTDGNRLFTSAADQTIRIWNRQQDFAARTLNGHATYVTCTAVSAAVDLFVTGG